VRRRNVIIIVAIAIVAISAVSVFVITDAFLASFQSELSNVSYCNLSNINEKMDIYFPSILRTQNNLREPVVIFVHGGGWIAGDKTENDFGFFQKLLNNSFIVASINYFLPGTTVPPYGFPLNIEDVACAVRFLRANASQYHIDAQHIGLLGDSAGGNLVSLEALSSLNSTFDNVGQYTGYSSQVQAVADPYGPTNITDPPFLYNPIIRNYTTESGRNVNIFQVVFGNSIQNMIRASPVDYVTSTVPMPPFLIEQGRNDTTVPMSQSVELYNALKAHGGSVQLVLVDNAGHGFTPVGGVITPPIRDVLDSVISFFNTTLR
jgi:acetyl esterase/lipase